MGEVAKLMSVFQCSHGETRLLGVRPDLDNLSHTPI